MRLPAIFVITLLVCLLIGCEQTTEPDPLSTPSPAVSPIDGSTANRGEPCPKFNLIAPDGTSIKFDPSDNPDNEAFLLLFWSYRFDPNVSTLLSRYGELHERYAPRGLTIVSVTYDEEPAGLRKFLTKNPLPFDVAVGSESTYEKYELDSIPTSILVDTNGRIVERWSGHYTTEEMAETISPYLPGRNGNSEE